MGGMGGSMRKINANNPFIPTAKESSTTKKSYGSIHPAGESWEESSFPEIITPTNHISSLKQQRSFVGMENYRGILGSKSNLSLNYNIKDALSSGKMTKDHS